MIDLQNTLLNLVKQYNSLIRDKMDPRYQGGNVQGHSIHYEVPFENPFCRFVVLKIYIDYIFIIFFSKYLDDK